MQAKRLPVLEWVLAQLARGVAVDLLPEQQAELVCILLGELRERVGRNLAYKELRNFVLGLGWWPSRGEREVTWECIQWSVEGGKPVPDPVDNIVTMHAFGPICFFDLAVEGETVKRCALLLRGPSTNAIIVEAVGSRDTYGRFKVTGVKVELPSSDCLHAWVLTIAKQVPNLLQMIVEGLVEQLRQWVEAQEERLATAREILHDARMTQALVARLAAEAAPVR